LGLALRVDRAAMNGTHAEADETARRWLCARVIPSPALDPLVLRESAVVVIAGLHARKIHIGYPTLGFTVIAGAEHARVGAQGADVFSASGHLHDPRAAGV
jgi:hypothetical protein